MTPSEKELHATISKADTELRVLERVHKSTIALQRVTIASLKRDKARMRNEWAGIEISHMTYMLAVAEWESRTGLSMRNVLEGTYTSPMGKSQ